MRDFANPFECYEAIGNWLSQAAPEPWKWIMIDFEIIVFDEVWEDCIHYKPKRWMRKEAQFFIDEIEFTDCFFQLARLTSKPELGFFNKFRFTLNENGTYKADFTYAD